MLLGLLRAGCTSLNSCVSTRSLCEHLSMCPDIADYTSQACAKEGVGLLSHSRLGVQRVCLRLKRAHDTFPGFPSSECRGTGCCWRCTATSQTGGSVRLLLRLRFWMAPFRTVLSEGPPLLSGMSKASLLRLASCARLTMLPSFALKSKVVLQPMYSSLQPLELGSLKEGVI